MSVYYKNSILNFINQNEDEILGILTKNDEFDSSFLQKQAWQKQISILKESLKNLSGDIIFEYTIPRIGRRIDNIIITQGIIFVLEFKVGEKSYNSEAEVQVRNYALDLSYFHKESHKRIIVPILIPTCAQTKNIEIKQYKHNIYDVIYSNGFNLNEIINKVIGISKKQKNINIDDWIESEYRPTPTIIEAAQELFEKHTVKEIAQNEAAENLTNTSQVVQDIIDHSKKNKKKSICFITGVPGAGKTLAGLKIAIENQVSSGSDYACFLSGNYPLVKVLQKALIKNAKARYKNVDPNNAVEDFIQIVHLFRDQSLNNIKKQPTENIVVFDEAQRAWNNQKLADFLMKRKSRVLNNIPQEKLETFLSMSESELFIEYMDRRKDWAVIVCLVGGGQDINDGEAGIEEWFNSIKKSFKGWDVYISNKITDREYIGNNSLKDVLSGMNYKIKNDLHLSISLRSFRNENVSKFIHYLLENDKDNAKKLYNEIKKVYPICMTRDLTTAKNWVKKKAKESGNINCRYGIIASSKAKRLRADGIWVQCKCTPEKWFLNDSDDIQSSYYMEEIATEFDVQGLEIDWAIVGWDADYRYENGQFNYYKPNGSRWNKIKDEVDCRYLKNAYRVLLTRAREGFIIYIPNGDDSDNTRLSKYYDELWKYLSKIGIEIIENETKCTIQNFNNINIQETQKKIFISSKTKTNYFTENTEELKIGKLVQSRLEYLFNKNLLTESEISNLKNAEYCKKTFNLSFPLLIDKNEKGIDSGGYSRYWQREIFGGKYKACSQWYKEQKQDFINWYNSIIE